MRASARDRAWSRPARPCDLRTGAMPFDPGRGLFERRHETLLESLQAASNLGAAGALGQRDEKSARRGWRRKGSGSGRRGINSEVPGGWTRTAFRLDQRPGHGAVYAESARSDAGDERGGRPAAQRSCCRRGADGRATAPEWGTCPTRADRRVSAKDAPGDLHRGSHVERERDTAHP
jgi:hypothetical protein